MEKANEVHVMMAIISGELPARPENAGIDELWSVCERCWQRNPADRPMMKTVVERLSVSRNDFEEGVILNNVVNRGFARNYGRFTSSRPIRILLYARRSLLSSHKLSQLLQTTIPSVYGNCQTTGHQ